MTRVTIPKVRVRRMKLGRGVYALRRLRRHQTIGEVTGRIIADPHYGSEYCIELSSDRNLEPGAPYRYLNHSCEPNCEIYSWRPRRGDDPGVSDRVFVQSLRTIQPGEELTIDYQWPAEVAIRCECGAAGCRGWVVSAEDLPAVLRREKRKPAARRRKSPAAAARGKSPLRTDAARGKSAGRRPAAAQAKGSGGSIRRAG